MNTASLPQLLNALSRAMLFEQRQAAIGAGLLPVQLAMLGYLRDANRYSNMPQCLAEYLGLTKGTVSQSLKILEERGWVLRQPDGADRRVVRLTLSEAGLTALERADDDAWRIAAQQLPANGRERLRRLVNTTAVVVATGKKRQDFWCLPDVPPLPARRVQPPMRADR